MQGWLERHPDWEHRLWTDESRPPLRNEQEFLATTYQVQRADILKYEVVLQHGGVYLDLDMECRRTIDPLLSDVEAFAAEEDPGRLAVGIFGAGAGHPWLRAVVESLSASRRDEPTIPEQTGPGFVTRVTRGRSDVTLFPSSYFYPYSYREPHRAGETFPDAYAIHHWQKSWAADEELERESQLRKVREAREAIEAVVAPGMTVVLIDGGEELGLEASRDTLRFCNRPGYWGNPADSAEAITEFDRLTGDGIDWVVFLDAAFWWFDHYSTFTDRVAQLSSAVEVRRGFRAYRVASGAIGCG
jgi:hypothetical protein